MESSVTCPGGEESKDLTVIKLLLLSCKLLIEDSFGARLTKTLAAHSSSAVVISVFFKASLGGGGSERLTRGGGGGRLATIGGDR
jgi:hypothetical protein